MDPEHIIDKLEDAAWHYRGPNDEEVQEAIKQAITIIKSWANHD